MYTGGGAGMTGPLGHQIKPWSRPCSVMESEGQDPCKCFSAPPAALQPEEDGVSAGEERALRPAVPLRPLEHPCHLCALYSKATDTETKSPLRAAQQH